MSRSWVAVLFVFLAGAAWPEPSSPLPAPHSAAFKKTSWEQLLPPGWDPAKVLRNLDFGRFADGDPRADSALEAMRQAWDTAPPNPKLEGAAVRMEGYLVPLRGDAKGNMLTMLIVPNFGGCIHVPPPPANQIVHVVFPVGQADFHAMDAVSVEGVLHLNYRVTLMGSAAYKMDGVSIQRLNRAIE